MRIVHPLSASQPIKKTHVSRREGKRANDTSPRNNTFSDVGPALHIVELKYSSVYLNFSTVSTKACQ